MGSLVDAMLNGFCGLVIAALIIAAVLRANTTQPYRKDRD